MILIHYLLILILTLHTSIIHTLRIRSTLSTKTIPNLTGNNVIVSKIKSNGNGNNIIQYSSNIETMDSKSSQYQNTIHKYSMKKDIISNKNIEQYDFNSKITNQIILKGNNNTINQNTQIVNNAVNFILGKDNNQNQTQHKNNSQKIVKSNAQALNNLNIIGNNNLGNQLSTAQNSINIGNIYTNNQKISLKGALKPKNYVNVNAIAQNDLTIKGQNNVVNQSSIVSNNIDLIPGRIRVFKSLIGYDDEDTSSQSSLI